MLPLFSSILSLLSSLLPSTFQLLFTSYANFLFNYCYLKISVHIIFISPLFFPLFILPCIFWVYGWNSFVASFWLPSPMPQFLTSSLSLCYCLPPFLSSFLDLLFHLNFLNSLTFFHSSLIWFFSFFLSFLKHFPSFFLFAICLYFLIPPLHNKIV